MAESAIWRCGRDLRQDNSRDSGSTPIGRPAAEPEGVTTHQPSRSPFSPSVPDLDIQFYTKTRVFIL